MVGSVQVVGRRDLAVVLAALDHDNLQPGALGHGRVVGQGGRFGIAERCRGAMRGQQRRRSGRPAASAPATGSWRGTVSVTASPSPDALQRIGERDAEDGAVDAPDATAGQAGLNVGTAHEGPGGIVDRHQVGRIGGQRLQAVQDGLLPADAATTRAAPGRALRRPGRSGRHLPDAITTRTALECLGRPGSASEGPAQDGLAFQKRILLGQRAAEAAAAAGGDDQGGARLRH